MPNNPLTGFPIVIEQSGNMLPIISLAAVAFAAFCGAAPPHGPPKPSLPSSFEWKSSGPLIFPKNDTRGVAGVKDPSVIYWKGKYHVFASTAQYVFLFFSLPNFPADFRR